MTVFFQIVEVPFGNGLHNFNCDFFYIFIATSSQIARATLCHFRTDLISVSVMLYDFFMAQFSHISEVVLFNLWTKWISSFSILNDFQLEGFWRITATNARSALASRALVADKNKNAVAFASVSGTAADVAFRLRSSRLSACTSLFRAPNRWPKRADGQCRCMKCWGEIKLLFVRKTAYFLWQELNTNWWWWKIPPWWRSCWHYRRLRRPSFAIAKKGLPTRISPIQHGKRKQSE